MAEMTDQQIMDYARELILSHALDIEFLSVIECYGDQREEEISHPDARRVHDLIGKAEVTVSFPEEL